MEVMDSLSALKKYPLKKIITETAKYNKRTFGTALGKFSPP